MTQSAAKSLNSAEQDSSTEPVPVEALHNGNVRAAYALWQGACAGGAMPSIWGMSPRRLGSLLRHVVLVRVLEGGEFQIRIVGEGIAQAFRTPMEGATMAELDARRPGFGSVLAAIYEGVCESRAPVAYRGWHRRDGDGRLFYHESLLLPFAEDGSTVDNILAVAAYALEPLSPGA